MRPTEAGQSALLLLDVVDTLQECGIPYAVIGAFAVSFYGEVRASLDADAVIFVHTNKEILTLEKLLKGRGLDVQVRRGGGDDPVRGVLNVLDRFGNRVDLLTGIRGMPEELFSRAQETRFMDVPLKIVSAEDLVALKLFAGNARDVQDAESILQVSGGKMDLHLLKKLATRYGPQCVRALQGLLKRRS
jgi:predicted nucleotidyltransferase